MIKCNITQTFTYGHFMMGHVNCLKVDGMHMCMYVQVLIKTEGFNEILDIINTYLSRSPLWWMSSFLHL